MRRRTTGRTLRPFALALAAVLVALPGGATAESNKDTITGTAVPVGSIGPSAATPFTVYVESYCTDDERMALARAMISEGQAGLIKLLRKMKKGRIQFGGRVGYDINAAVSHQTERGRLVRLVVDRPITFFELRNASRSRDYQIAFIEFELDGEGKGSGQMIVAAQVSVDKKGAVEVESYTNTPVRLQGVSVR